MFSLDEAFLRTSTTGCPPKSEPCNDPGKSKDSNEVFDRRQARSKSLGRPTRTPNKPNRDAVTPKYYDNGDKIEDLGTACWIIDRPKLDIGDVLCHQHHCSGQYFLV